MVAYYNENNPQAAAWLRELINAGAIAPGNVDERSILDVPAADLSAYTQVHLFAGSGAWSTALRNAGWPDSRPAWSGSPPCQPFSVAGKRAGADDPRDLWWAMFWLIRQCRPSIIFGEQVASKDGEGWWDIVQTDLENQDYAATAFDLPAAGIPSETRIPVSVFDLSDAQISQLKDEFYISEAGFIEHVGFSCPHIRHRFFWVAHDCRPRLEGRSQQPAREECAPAQRGGNAEPLADSQSSECQRQRPQQNWAPGRFADSGIERLANPDDTQRRQGTADRDHNLGETPQRSQSSDRARECSTVSELGHSDRPGSGRDTRGILTAETGCDLKRSEDGRIANSPKLTGAGDCWADVVWLPCQDGKLRPAKPGLQPLVDGAAPDLVRDSDTCTPQTEATSEARTMRLRGYGNAIVAPLAQVFIESCMDVLRERGI